MDRKGEDSVGEGEEGGKEGNFRMKVGWYIKFNGKAGVWLGGWGGAHITPRDKN